MLVRLASPWADYRGYALTAVVVAMIVYVVSMGVTRLTLGVAECLSLQGWIAMVAVAIALGCGLSMYRSDAPALAAERAKFERDLAAGTAVRTTYEVVDALSVEEYDDEGSAYYLKLADGRVLFLQGQFLYEYEAGEDDDGRPVPARFPASRFTIERTAESGHFLDLLDLGAPLVPSGTLSAFTSADYLADKVPGDGEVLTVDFESLRRSRRA
jgi:hypothetical protein